MPDRQKQATLRPAATVMLLREAAGGLEVLVIRRHENLAFMGGMWVFPGGALCAADASDSALMCIPEHSKLRCAQLADLHGRKLSQRECLGLTVAAYRETFEETGVLLATDPGGNHCRDATLARVQEQRRALASNPELFAALLEREQLQLDVERLTYWAHWITPSSVPRRFDTHFFAISVPAGQTAMIDTVEAVDHAWMSPAALIEAAASRTMSLATPTLYNLMDLEASRRSHGSLEAILAAGTQRQIVPVLPRTIRDGSTIAVMPWDPEYSDLEGEGVPAGIEYPSTLRALPSRVSIER